LFGVGEALLEGPLLKPEYDILTEGDVLGEKVVKVV
jgi:hypothetical protein